MRNQRIGIKLKIHGHDAEIQDGTVLRGSVSVFLVFALLKSLRVCNFAGSFLLAKTSMQSTPGKLDSGGLWSAVVDLD